MSLKWGKWELEDAMDGDGWDRAKSERRLVDCGETNFATEKGVPSFAKLIFPVNGA